MLHAETALQGAYEPASLRGSQNCAPGFAEIHLTPCRFAEFLRTCPGKSALLGLFSAGCHGNSESRQRPILLSIPHPQPTRQVVRSLAP
jgi:hypothetical protein